eukprot:TRINITY_DN18134_c0_g1_i1.p1 TRINITY_DN18134_c0_g1~~TRINITY_DN18134_c0_g1_i1.p1  ORF type:complete len:149 (+),score=13.18 TRINITY_DN18134_c0_g1_i1:96-542(+)
MATSTRQQAAITNMRRRLLASRQRPPRLRFILILLASRFSAGFAQSESVATVGSELEANEQLLALRYPGLIQCNPGETYGCISRCHRGVHREDDARDKMCLMLGCINGCTMLVTRECAQAGLAACKMIHEAMTRHGVICGVECGSTGT